MHSTNNNTGLTLLGALTTLCVIIILLTLFYVLVVPAFPIRRTPYRVVCGTNLKGLGTAMTVYANDYDDRFPQLPGEGPWSKQLGFDYHIEKPDFVGQHLHTDRSVTASWYLLVKEADVSPRSLVCPNSTETEFDGQNPANLDIVQLWDFGDQPQQHVSYAMHLPYGRYPANGQLKADFAVAADMNPWMQAGDFVSTPTEKQYRQIITGGDPSTWKFGNSFNHPEESHSILRRGKTIKGTAAGQNVLFADGHTMYLEQPNCGVNADNIYTRWSTDNNPTAQDIQGGIAPTARDAENDAQSKDDSFLVI